MDKHDLSSPQRQWTVRAEILEKVTIGGQEYFRFRVKDYMPGETSEFLFRITDSAVYRYDGETEVTEFLAAPVGTTFSYYKAGPEGEQGRIVKEIVGIEPVTVPYGTFQTAYVHQARRVPDDPSRPPSPPWYEWYVPGMLLVKEVDYNIDDAFTPSTVSELARMGVSQVSRFRIEDFVSRFYRQCLGRDPDRGGLDFWVRSLQQGTKTGADVARGFILSGEFSSRGVSDEGYLAVLYRAFFGREPDEGGFESWLSRLRGGTARSQVLEGFIHSQEFAGLCDRYGIVPYPGNAVAARLRGEYSIVVYGADWDGMPWTEKRAGVFYGNRRMFTLRHDGIEDTYHYTLNNNGQMTATGPYGPEHLWLSVSRDGNVFWAADADWNDTGDVKLIIGLKKSQGRSNASLRGEYLYMIYGGSDLVGSHAAVGSAVFDGGGHGTYRTLDDSDGEFSQGTFTYTVRPDGEVAITDENGFIFQGHISADGNFAGMVGEYDLLLFVKKPRAGWSNASLNGEFRGAEFEDDPDVTVHSTSCDGNGGCYHRKLADSDGDPPDEGPAEVSLGNDGHMVITTDGEHHDQWVGISPDGGIYITCDTDNTNDDDALIGIGIRR